MHHVAKVISSRCGVMSIKPTRCLAGRQRRLLTRCFAQPGSGKRNFVRMAFNNNNPAQVSGIIVLKVPLASKQLRSTGWWKRPKSEDPEPDIAA